MDDEEKIQETFLILKQEDSRYELKKIAGGYYVYLSSGRSDGTGKKKISIYKGKITPDGTFVKVRHRHNSLRKAVMAVQQENFAV